MKNRYWFVFLACLFALLLIGVTQMVTATAVAATDFPAMTDDPTSSTSLILVPTSATTDLDQLAQIDMTGKPVE